jgi:uncharacterized membrane-anchored protein
MKFKKIWNNRKFRTFLQTLISTITTYFMATNIFEIDSKAMISLLITAIATGLSAVMPLLDEEE